MLSSLLVRFRCLWTDQLITGRAGFWCVFLGVSVCFGWFWVFVVCFSFLHGDSSMDYVSILFSSLLYAFVVMTDVATALIRWICKMQSSFRLDKRPGESHLALDGKKNHFSLSRLLYLSLFRPRVVPFARNEGRCAETAVKLRFYLCRSNPFRTKRCSIVKNWSKK